MNLRIRFRRPGLLFLTVLLPSLLSAATYLPMSDTDLSGQALVIVRATVIGTEVELVDTRGASRPFTLVTLRRIEAIKGAIDEVFIVALPGGRAGDAAWFVPGTPAFSPGEEVVLMLAPVADRPGMFRLTELGLSKFDIVSDDTGRRFAVRPAFPAEADLVASKRASATGAPAGARDAEAFLAFLRAAGRGERPSGDVVYGLPLSAREKWVNLGGREPGDCGSGGPCLWRWFWDTGASPNAVLMVNGTQSNLDGNDEPKCGTDSICDVQNVATAWTGVVATDIRLSGPSPTGNIVVNLDSTESQDGGVTWNTPLGCTGGIIGLGGPGEGTGPRTYRGDTTYYSISNGTVSMRKSSCTSSYSAATFRSAVLHEVGHVLGLNHPDDPGIQSIHSTTTPTDWSNAVMHAVIGVFKPDKPQTDDIQAVQYYYGTAPVGPLPVANFTWSPTSPPALSGVTFTDTSTGSPTGWNWDFGDPDSAPDNTATTKTATHRFSKSQTYHVTLTVGSLSGTSAISFPVTAGPPVGNCTSDSVVLCLNQSRFHVMIQWNKTDLTSGTGNAVSLGDDSGYFWFFDPTNTEAIVKVLNGCAINGHYWVFAAGLTNIGTQLSISDTATNATKLYTNPLGTPFAPIQDTTAFATCP